MMIKMVGLYIRGDFFTCPNPLSFDPYSKCFFDCKYCFIKQMEQTILKPIANKPLKHANLKELEQLLKRSKEKDISKNPVVNALKHLPVIIGRKCEPLLSRLKGTFDTTLGVVKLFRQYDIKTIIETKNVVNIDPYLNFVDGFNISVMPGKHHKILEPGIPSVEKRFEMAKKAKDAGLHVGIVGEPIMPTLNSSYNNIAAWFNTIMNYLEPDHINFGELRYHSAKICDEMFSSVGIDLLPIAKGTKNWVEIGNMIFDISEQYDLKISTPDWVNFADRNSCHGCCGLDKFGTHNFNFQYAKSFFNKYEEVDWNDMLKQDIFKSNLLTNKFSSAFNINKKKYYNLTDVGARAERGRDKTITYKKGKKITLKDAFR